MVAGTRVNFKHLRYFAEVAQRGSVTAAARALFVAPQTVSAQLLELEESVGQALFERAGRRLILTPAGATALDYAKTIFSLGDELAAVLRGTSRARNIALRVGVTDSVPKTMTVTLMQPLIQRHQRELELVCREGPFAELLGRAAAGELDMVLADSAVPGNLARSLQARVLAESGISFVGVKALAQRAARDFPARLDGLPFLAGAAPSSLLGQAIEAWFARHAVRPLIVGRIEDSALLKGFAQSGLGLIAVPTSIEAEVMRQFGLALAGRTDEVRQSIFLVRPRSRRVHPLVAELENSAMHSAKRVP
jgi:LysR family transcriptional activator of nhaA